VFAKYLVNGISYGDDLRGFEIDIEAFLDESEILSNANVISSSDAQCMIKASCRFSDNFTEKEVVLELKEIWLDYLRYQEFERHTCEISAGKVVFHFCTTSGSLGVSGKIIATRT